ETHGISLTKPCGLVRCIFHAEQTPSLSIDTERGLFHCFGCGVGGGVRKFAELVGEQWGNTRRESRVTRARFAVQARRRQAEQQARAILQQRKDDREDTLWREWCEANSEATSAADLLGLFFRRPDLAEEFSALAERTEQEYGEAVSRRARLEAQIAE